MADAAHQARTELIEAVAEYDEKLMEDYLEEKPIEPDRLIEDIRKATLDISMTPVLCGSAFKNKGVQPLLDAVIDYLPSPLDVPSIEGLDADENPIHARRLGRRALRRARLQGHGRPVRRQAHLLPRLQRQAQRRRARAQLRHRPHRARRPHPDDARQHARGGRGGVRGRHRRRRGPQADLHRRHALGARRPGDPRARWSSRTRSCTSRSSRRRRSTRRSCRWRSSASARRTRPSRCAPTRRPARP